MNTIRTNESFNDNEHNEGESSFLSRAEEFYRVITGFWPFLRIRESVLFPAPSKSVSGDPTEGGGGGSPLLSLIISVLLVSPSIPRSGNETVLAIKRIQRKDPTSRSKLLWDTCFRRRFDLQPILRHFPPTTCQVLRNKKFRSLEFLSVPVLAAVLK